MGVVRFILGLFANPPDTRPDHLFYIPEEIKALRKIYEDSTLAIKQKFVEETLTKEELEKSIRPDPERFVVVHYSGHANSFSLQLDDERMMADNFIEVVKLCQGVQLVVLNGCSTQGFVKRLLEATTVKGVIATPRPVNDQTAMLFAKEFYTNLLQNIKVEFSFTQALSSALGTNFIPNANVFRVYMQGSAIQEIELLTEKNTTTNARGVTKLDDTVFEPTKGSSWGLYVKEEAFLNWQLFPDETQKAAIKKQAIELKKELFSLKADLMVAQQEVNAFREVVNPPEALKPFIQKSKDALAKIEAAIGEKEAEIRRLVIDDENLRREKEEEEAIQTYQNAFGKLNFSTQKDLIQTAAFNDELSKVQGFIVHGTPVCGLHQLCRNLLAWTGTKKLAGKMVYPYDSSHGQSFWDKFRKDLQLNAIVEPALLMKEFHTRYRNELGSTIDDFALVFCNNSSDSFRYEDVRNSIFQFWKEFTTLFLEMDQAYTNFNHRVFLFLLDDRCSRDNTSPVFLDTRKSLYEAHFPQQKLAGASVKILPHVDLIKAADIHNWQVENSVPTGYRYSSNELCQLILDTAGLLEPTVEEISNRKIINPGKRGTIHKIFTSSILNDL